MNFSELNISENLRNAVQKKGFLKASLVQEKVIPSALAGKDIVGKSQTGTGKTAAFGIPLIEKIVPRQGLSALIVVPTRELAVQVKEEIQSLAIGSGIKIVAVFGGQSISNQIQLLERNPEIVVGTPGRLLDLLARNRLSFRQAKFLVLDEADKMFDMGFREDIEEIISFFPKQRQTMLFSATMPKQIFSLAGRHLKHDKIFVDLSIENAPVKEVEQFYLMVDRNRKLDALFRILEKERNAKTLVFCRTKKTVDWLERQLYRRRLKVFALHGDKPQNFRLRTLENYKSHSSGALIATDIVARGIHVEDIDNVINFDFPEESETYLHRIGRTARQGRKGKAISFCANVLELEQLERTGLHKNCEIQEMRF